ncbi:GL25605 [Drosophila persimilis]|uniref:GL25605 n=1 Tax=Drosophila persimilis TaxID=7234 RepID=B4GUB6_DROPE|nr:GL25605 [Drosophila persimilis]
MCNALCECLKCPGKRVCCVIRFPCCNCACKTRDEHSLLNRCPGRRTWIDCLLRGLLIIISLVSMTFRSRSPN